MIVILELLQLIMENHIFGNPCDVFYPEDIGAIEVNYYYTTTTKWLVMRISTGICSLNFKKAVEPEDTMQH